MLGQSWDNGLLTDLPNSLKSDWMPSNLFRKCTNVRILGFLFESIYYFPGGSSCPIPELFWCPIKEED